MAENDIWKRYLDAGVYFTEMTRKRAEAIVKDLVKAGEVQQGRTQKSVDDILNRSRRNTEELLSLVRQEIRDQVGALGIATREDIARLEGRIKRLEGTVGSAPAKKASAKKAGGAKKAGAAKKAPPAATP